MDWSTILHECQNFYFFTEPEPEPEFTKILLITGGPHETGKKSEIIDLTNPYSTCDSWPSYPIEVEGAFGALLDSTILICGGEG